MDLAAFREASGTERPISIHGLVRGLCRAERGDEILAAARRAVGLRAATMDNSERAPRLPVGVFEQARSAAEPYVLAEQDDLCALWKPPGWTVSMAGGVREPALNKGLGNSRVLENWADKVLGTQCPIARDPKADHGLVHRLDRNTSGALLLAKTYRGYHLALLQFVALQVVKEYVLLCSGFVQATGLPWRLDAPLLVVGHGPARQTVVAPQLGKHACTEVLRVGHLFGPNGTELSLVRVRLHTGRRHQIRVHFSSVGHPLVGDDRYGGPCSVVAGGDGKSDSGKAMTAPRLFLHACRLRVDIGQGPLDVNSPLPGDLREVLRSTRAATPDSEPILHAWLEGSGG